MCSDIGTASRVCAMYSFTGIIFTVSYMTKIDSGAGMCLCVKVLSPLLTTYRGTLRLGVGGIIV